MNMKYVSREELMEQYPNRTVLEREQEARIAKLEKALITIISNDERDCFHGDCISVAREALKP
jgi:hypothetical protein